MSVYSYKYIHGFPLHMACPMSMRDCDPYLIVGDAFNADTLDLQGKDTVCAIGMVRQAGFRVK